MFDMKRKAGDAIPDLLSYNKEKVFSSRYFVTLGSMIIHVGQNWKWISSGSFREILQNFGRLVTTVSLK